MHLVGVTIEIYYDARFPTNVKKAHEFLPRKRRANKSSGDSNWSSNNSPTDEYRTHLESGVQGPTPQIPNEMAIKTVSLQYTLHDTSIWSLTL